MKFHSISSLYLIHVFLPVVVSSRFRKRGPPNLAISPRRQTDSEECSTPEVLQSREDKEPCVGTDPDVQEGGCIHLVAFDSHHISGSPSPIDVFEDGSEKQVDALEFNRTHQEWIAMYEKRLKKDTTWKKGEQQISRRMLRSIGCGGHRFRYVVSGKVAAVAQVIMGQVEHSGQEWAGRNKLEGYAVVYIHNILSGRVIGDETVAKGAGARLIGLMLSRALRTAKKGVILIGYPANDQVSKEYQKMGLTAFGAGLEYQSAWRPALKILGKYLMSHGMNVLNGYLCIIIPGEHVDLYVETLATRGLPADASKEYIAWAALHLQ